MSNIERDWLIIELESVKRERDELIAAMRPLSAICDATEMDVARSTVTLTRDWFRKHYPDRALPFNTWNDK